jgi:dTDP-4-amino-4,6-dideoxygalactose transaminase
MTPLPFLDLRPGLERDRPLLQAAFDEVLASGTFILGPLVERFERELAAFVGVRHAVGVASGSDALELALRALGVGPGDAVVTTPFTFVATAEAIVHAGARPLFADVDPATWLLDLAAVDRALDRLPRERPGGPRRLPSGERVRAIVPVHLFGAVVDARALDALAAAHGLVIVEDAAQALGGASHGRPAGAIGAAGCLSFFPTKTLGALGDGGAVLTDDEALARSLRALRQHGCVERGRPEGLGRNSRLDALQAAFLSAKLSRLPADLDERRALRRRYHEALAGLGPELAPLGPPEPCEGHAAALLVTRARRRDELARHLRARGVGAAVYYEQPLHALAPYASAPRLGPLEAAERAARESLALPLYPGLDPAAIGRVAAEIEHFTAARGPLDRSAPGPAEPAARFSRSLAAEGSAARWQRKNAAVSHHEASGAALLRDKECPARAPPRLDRGRGRWLDGASYRARAHRADRSQSRAPDERS